MAAHRLLARSLVALTTSLGDESGASSTGGSPPAGAPQPRNDDEPESDDDDRSDEPPRDRIPVVESRERGLGEPLPVKVLGPEILERLRKPEATAFSLAGRRP